VIREVVFIPLLLLPWPALSGWAEQIQPFMIQD